MLQRGLWLWDDEFAIGANNEEWRSDEWKINERTGWTHTDRVVVFLLIWWSEAQNARVRPYLPLQLRTALPWAELIRKCVRHTIVDDDAYGPLTYQRARCRHSTNMKSKLTIHCYYYHSARACRQKAHRATCDLEYRPQVHKYWVFPFTHRRTAATPIEGGNSRCSSSSNAVENYYWRGEKNTKRSLRLSSLVRDP